MTLPFERLNAIKNAREFLRSLLDPKKTPKVPKKIRLDAYYVLKHFPMDYHMERTEEALPEIWGKFEGGNPTKEITKSKKTKKKK